MTERKRVAVYGYVRMNHIAICPNDIIEIIFNFYLIPFESKIVTPDEEVSLNDLVITTLKTQNGHDNIKYIDSKLLYRASEHNFSGTKFHECCDNKGATMVIIHNETNHVYGGYTSKSWITKPNLQISDPNAFLFSVRPKIKLAPLKKEYAKKGENAIWVSHGYGPIFGAGADIYVSDKGTGVCASYTYDFNHLEMSPTVFFKVNDYEVFAVSVS